MYISVVLLLLCLFCTIDCNDTKQNTPRETKKKKVTSFQWYCTTILSSTFFFCILMIILNFLHRQMATNTTATHRLIDIGANLTHKSFRYTIDQVLERAGKAQVSDIIVTGTSLSGSRDASNLAMKYNQTQQLVKLYSTAGIHPHEATRHSAYNYREQLADLLQKNRTIVALGECGLDFDRNFSSPDDQRQVFDTQLQLACEYNLPLFLHERSASTEMLSMLQKYSQHVNFRGVMHCFTHASVDVLQQYLSLNLYIGITGWVCDERRGKDLAKLITHIPLDRLLIETDAPFLLPRNMSKPWPSQNEPSCLPFVVKKLAECYSVSTDKIAEHSTENARKLFNL